MDPETDDDEVWRAIVENYGDRVDLEPEAVVVEPEPVWTEPFTIEGAWERYDEDEQFVPPTPPPLPALPPDRLAAWLGLFGSPAVLLVFLLVGVSIPSWLGLLLILGFVGGFVYLVVRMPRGPRDPYDDGAVL